VDSLATQHGINWQKVIWIVIGISVVLTLGLAMIAKPNVVP
jgi:hypothetical protein